MNFNTHTRNLSTCNHGWAKRHPFAALTLGMPIFALSLMMTILIGVGFAQAAGSNAGPGQITIQRSGNMYADCAEFAQADGYATDVCEGLDSRSQSAVLSCAAEVAYAMTPVDCPKR